MDCIRESLPHALNDLREDGETDELDNRMRDDLDDLH